MHLPTFIKELGPPSLLAWVNNFILYIRKEMVYSKLLSFSIMRKLRNCVSPLNVKIVKNISLLLHFLSFLLCIMSTFLVKHPVAYSAKCVSSETCWPVLYELHNCVIMAFQWVWCCSYSGIIPCKLNSRIVTRSFRTEKGDNLVVADCKSWASKEFSF